MLTLQYMMSMTNWRLKEKEDEVKKEDIVCAEWYKISVSLKYWYDIETISFPSKTETLA